MSDNTNHYLKYLPSSAEFEQLAHELYNYAQRNDKISVHLFNSILLLERLRVGEMPPDSVVRARKTVRNLLQQAIDHI